jgi:hypothetical protein
LSEKELFSKIVKGSFLIPDYVSTEAKHLLQNILTVNPSNRLDALNVNNYILSKIILILDSNSRLAKSSNKRRNN